MGRHPLCRALSLGSGIIGVVGTLPKEALADRCLQQLAAAIIIDPSTWLPQTKGTGCGPGAKTMLGQLDLPLSSWYDLFDYYLPR